MTSTQAPDFDTISSNFSRYVLVQPLATRLMPYSYRLRHASSSRESTLYLVPVSHAGVTGWDDDFMDRAVRATRLQHPNLIRVEEAGETAGYYYVIVEHSAEPRLEEMSSYLPLPPFSALECVKSLATGLQLAHASGVVNGRIDGRTVHMNSRFFCRVLPINPAPRRILEEEKEYYAPETFRRGRRPEASDDTFALGMVAYYLLTGKLPSGNRRLMPSCLGPASRQVDEFVSNAISPSKSRRYETSGSMIAAINDVLPCAEKEKKPMNLKGGKPVVIVSEGGTLTYFYLIPLLLIAIAMSYVVLQYRKDYGAIRNEHNELIKAVKIVVTAEPRARPR